MKHHLIASFEATTKEKFPVVKEQPGRTILEGLGFVIAHLFCIADYCLIWASLGALHNLSAMVSWRVGDGVFSSVWEDRHWLALYTILWKDMLHAFHSYTSTAATVSLVCHMISSFSMSYTCYRYCYIVTINMLTGYCKRGTAATSTTEFMVARTCLPGGTTYC